MREHYMRELTAATPDIEYASADSLLSWSRAVKTQPQVKLIGQAASGATQVLRSLMAADLVGKSERELRIELRGKLADAGADGSYTVVAAGADAAIPDHRAGEQLLANGQPLLIDAAVSYDGFAAEVALSRVLGNTAPGPAKSALDALYRCCGSKLG